MHVTLDGLSINNEHDVHEQLVDQLDFGEYYGNNFAALWDRLSTDISRPVKLVWLHSKLSKAALGLKI